MSQNQDRKVDLDDNNFLLESDPDGMLDTLAGLPDQCEIALKLGKDALLWPESANVLPDLSEELRQVVMAGLGGSAIGGDLVRVVVARQARVPFAVCRDYNLPAYVDKKTLVLLTSYSGNTEETLSAYRVAGERGATRLVLTTGGQLAEMAIRDGVPVVRVPAGLPPRSAIGYLFLTSLVLLERMGVIGHQEGYGELLAVLRSCREDFGPASPRSVNQAKELALRLHGKIPVIYGACGTTEVLATRWKGQFNENAKCLAYWNTYPELNHNELVGFEAPPELLRSLFLIHLRDTTDHPRVQARMEIVKKVLADRVGGMAEFSGQGESFLARLFSLIYLGDYTSVYLSMLYGINPKPVQVIDYLKQELANLADNS
jgi:glucose/mannose-6-phosphate isomerase